MVKPSGKSSITLYIPVAGSSTVAGEPIAVLIASLTSSVLNPSGISAIAVVIAVLTSSVVKPSGKSSITLYIPVASTGLPSSSTVAGEPSASLTILSTSAVDRLFISANASDIAELTSSVVKPSGKSFITLYIPVAGSSSVAGEPSAVFIASLTSSVLTPAGNSDIAVVIAVLTSSVLTPAGIAAMAVSTISLTASADAAFKSKLFIASSISP